jgi:hypothetical protein
VKEPDDSVCLPVSHFLIGVTGRPIVHGLHHMDTVRVDRHSRTLESRGEPHRV